MEVFIGHSELYNLGKPIELGRLVGSGKYFETKEAIPNAIRYPGKIIWEGESLYYLWTDLSFKKLNKTAIELASDLNGIIELNSMIDSHKVKYDGDNTVRMAINTLFSLLGQPQRQRIIIPAAGTTINLTGVNVDYIISFHINRVPYEGKKGTSFDGWDFTFQYSETDPAKTVITLNVGALATFEPGDIVDIKYVEV